MWKRSSGFFRSVVNLSAVDTDVTAEPNRPGLLSRKSAFNLRQDETTSGKRGVTSKALLRTRQSIANIWNRQRYSQAGPYGVETRDSDTPSDDGASISTIRPDEVDTSSIQMTPRAMTRSYSGEISPLDLDGTSSSRYESDYEIDSEEMVPARNASQVLAPDEVLGSDGKARKRRSGVWNSLLHPRSSVSDLLGHRANSADFVARVDTAADNRDEAQRRHALEILESSANVQHPAPMARNIKFQDFEAACALEEAHSVVQRRDGVPTSAEREPSTAMRRSSRWGLFHKRGSTANLRYDSTLDGETAPARNREKRSSVLSLHDVWDRWGPERWQKREGIAAEPLGLDPISPTAGKDEEAPGSSAQDFLREYSSCMDPYGYVAAISDLQRWRFEESVSDAQSIAERVLNQPVNEDTTPVSSHSVNSATQPNNIEAVQDKASYSSTESTAQWSVQTTINALRCLEAASDPDGFSLDDDDSWDYDDYWQ